MLIILVRNQHLDQVYGTCVKFDALAVPPIVKAAVVLSLIEYPNLPAPYKPPLASPEPDVLPYTSEPSAWAAVWSVEYLKSR